MSVLLGALTELVYEDRKGKCHGLRWGMSVAPALVIGPRGRLLVVYEPRIVGHATERARREYRRLHWSEPGQGRSLEGVCAGPPLAELGDVVMITYTTKKGRAALTDYEHAFKKPRPIVLEHRCRDPKCPSRGRILLRGGHYRVRTEGIVG